MAPPKGLLLYSLSLVYIFSCGSLLTEPTQTTQSTVPQLSALNGINWQAQNRSPAATKPPRAFSSLSRSSHKQIYFQTLYQQFQKFQTFHPEFKQSLRYCPSFHNTFLKLKPTQRQKRHPFSRIAKGDIKLPPLTPTTKRQLPALFPEIALPTTHGPNSSTVYHKLQHRANTSANHPGLLEQGLQVHVEKIFLELQQLCHLGHTQNYFAFANMITYTQQNPYFKQSTQALSALLKISLFANHTLLQSLHLHRHPQVLRAPNPLEREVISRLNAQWSLRYFQELQKRRLSWSR